MASCFASPWPTPTDIETRPGCQSHVADVPTVAPQAVCWPLAVLQGWSCDETEGGTIGCDELGQGRCCRLLQAAPTPPGW